MSKLGALKIQDDLTEPFVFFVFPAIFFFEGLNGALQHGILLPDFRENLHEKLGLFHAAFTTLHAGLIRHAGRKILLVFLVFTDKLQQTVPGFPGTNAFERFAAVAHQRCIRYVLYVQMMVMRIQLSFLSVFNIVLCPKAHGA